MRRVRDMAEGSQSIEVLRLLTSEGVEFSIDSIANNRHQHEEALNIPNRGYIENLPEGAIVEVPGIVSAAGAAGCAVGSLPEAVAALRMSQYCRFRLPDLYWSHSFGFHPRDLGIRQGKGREN